MPLLPECGPCVHHSRYVFVHTFIFIMLIVIFACWWLQGNREFRAFSSSFHLSFLISYIGRHVVVGYRATLQLILLLEHSDYEACDGHWWTYISFNMKCYFVLYQQAIRTPETKQQFVNSHHPLLQTCVYLILYSLR
jgi:hypothetical protein